MDQPPFQSIVHPTDFSLSNGAAFAHAVRLPSQRERLAYPSRRRGGRGDGTEPLSGGARTAYAMANA